MSRGGTTLTDVARAAGVSLSTASLAFSGAGPIADATRAKVLAAAAELEYHGPDPVAASLRRGRSGVVGVLMGGAVRRSFRDPVSIQFLDGVVTTLAAQGHGTLLLSAAEGHDAVEDLVRHGAMDAAVLMGGAFMSRRTMEVLAARRLPTVQIGGSGRQGTTVRAREKEAMCVLGQHLRERGHSRVAVATMPWHSTRRSGPVDLTTAARPTSPFTARRLDGLRAAGLEPVAAWECSGSLVEEGIAAGKAMLKYEPTALIGFSDLIAAGLLLAAQEAGLTIPDQVAVAGFDGVNLPWLGETELTSIMLPIADMGRHAATAALALARGEEAPSVLMDAELRVGTTT